MQTVEIKPLMNTLAPMKEIGARLEEPAYELTSQDIHWAEPGAINVLSASHCLIELAETPAPGRARYLLQTADGVQRPAGALNFMPPHSMRTVHWNEGRRRAVVCLLVPERLGLLGSIDWRWQDIDPAATIDVQSENLRIGMQWLAEELAAPSFASGLRVTSLLTMLTIELHRHCVPQTAAGAETAVPQGRLSSRQIAHLAELVEGAADGSGPSLAELAAACRLPARDLSTMFRRTTGQTLRSYVADTHIARAKVLLDDSQLMVKQVAFRCGFRSAAAFGDAFRRATGATPQQYRQRQSASAFGRSMAEH